MAGMLMKMVDKCNVMITQEFVRSCVVFKMHYFHRIILSLLLSVMYSIYFY